MSTTPRSKPNSTRSATTRGNLHLTATDDFLTTDDAHASDYSPTDHYNDACSCPKTLTSLG